MDSKCYIERAVECAGTQVALAERIGVRQQHVWNWLNRDKRVPAEYCLPIERATHGAVTRYDLRPDVFGQSPEAA
jgi:DNA-binding transcriptional regulator YdaS (Cro superfamily)